MKIYSIYQVDAFAEKVFEGNPAAVVPLQKWLPAAKMRAIAAENNLAETAFFIPNEKGFDLRWFTPTIEVDLCGHATLATAHVLFQHLNYDKNAIYFQTRVGELTVKKTVMGYEMDFPADKLTKVEEVPVDLQKAINAPILEVWQGRDDYLIMVEKEADIVALTPDLLAIKSVGGRGVIVTAKSEQYDFVSRCFFPAAGVNEDPVTGSAHTSMTPFWAKKLNKTSLTARQISSRGGNVFCELKGDRVLLSGQAQTYLKGEIWI